MAKASTTTTIDPAEAAHFGKLAADWWNPAGSSAMLHKLNPVRLKFIREVVDQHFGGDGNSFRPLAGRTALDVGCGAGLLCEPLARLGAQVTGLDAAPESIGVAQAHAAEAGVAIDYRCADVARIDGEFDLVTSMEVIEHVSDPLDFLSALRDRMAEGGLLVMSTPNRTPKSKLAMITLGEGLGAIPKGTHDWDKFLTPEEMKDLLANAGLQVGDMRGISFSPTAGLHLSDDLSLNYIFTATRI
jgi:2-polyprenyl-6-hydroxyphenyl methylase / 3-demethylubiquinone-9 3-methyltransferase